MPASDWLSFLRQTLHSMPEISGAEQGTAALIAQELARFSPDHLLTDVGGTGVVAVFDGAATGPTIGIRAELDALPIHETSALDYRSRYEGVAHLCGHDGHMCMVLALAKSLAQARPKRGRVVLIFQPSEETGHGAAQLRGDVKFAPFMPDFLFSLHNLPGAPLGQITVPSGAANCASRGVKFTFQGQTSHAAAPWDGRSPMEAIAQLMPKLAALGRPAGGVGSANFTLATLTHATLGQPTFGIAPGYGEVWATLRSATDTAMHRLCQDAESLAKQAADAGHLALDVSYHEVFEACVNNAEAVAALTQGFAAQQIPYQMSDVPQLWSEDFGQFAQGSKTVMFWIGSGEDQPQLHTPQYDFPDALLPMGVAAFAAVLRDMLG